MNYPNSTNISLVHVSLISIDVFSLIETVNFARIWNISSVYPTMTGQVWFANSSVKFSFFSNRHLPLLDAPMATNSTSSRTSPCINSFDCRMFSTGRWNTITIHLDLWSTVISRPAWIYKRVDRTWRNSSTPFSNSWLEWRRRMRRFLAELVVSVLIFCKEILKNWLPSTHRLRDKHFFISEHCLILRVD